MFPVSTPRHKTYLVHNPIMIDDNHSFRISELQRINHFIFGDKVSNKIITNSTIQYINFIGYHNIPYEYNYKSNKTIRHW